MPIATSSIPSWFDTVAERYARRPCIGFRGRALSYADLHREVERLASRLAGIGLCKDEPVALYLPNSPWHPIVFLALLALGARVVHLSPLDAPRELAFKLQDSGATTLVATDLPGLWDQAAALLANGHARRILLAPDAHWGDQGISAPISTADTILRLDQLPEPATRWVPPPLAAADVALLQYTGGTTGKPKAALLTHGNLTAAVTMYGLWSGDTNAPDEPDRVIGVLPLFHIYALTVILLHSLDRGDEIILHQRFDPGVVLRDIATRRATTMAGVPTMWIALANHPDLARTDLSSLRSAVSGGAPMPDEVAARVERLVGRRLLGGWGMTETAPAGTRIPAAAPPSPGLIGAPLPGIDLRVVSLDDPSRVLPPGERGELAIAGANVFAGYANRPEANEAAFCDGYFLTGDIGSMDETGLFHIVDRKTSLIISGGFNVYPAVIENALYEHPAVAEAIVIGVPDAYRGEAARAFITLREGAPPPDPDAMQAFLAERLGRHELPSGIEIREGLPRSPAGKLLRAALVEELRSQ